MTGGHPAQNWPVPLSLKPLCSRALFFRAPDKTWKLKGANTDTLIGVGVEHLRLAHH